MMKKPVYPLEQVALIKDKRLEEAEKVLKEKKLKLEEEEKKLEAAKKKRDEVKKHKHEKIRKYMDEVMEGITSDKIQMHEKYIKDVVEQELKEEERKVKDQKEHVKRAEEALEKAREDRQKKNLEVEKMKLHRLEWEREMKFEMEKSEGLVNDELGSNIHTIRKHFNKGNKG